MFTGGKGRTYAFYSVARDGVGHVEVPPPAGDATTRISGAALDGDFNGNGRVEQADLDLVLLNWGRDASTPPGGWVNDLPDGRIDQEELDAVLLHWGDVAAGQASASPVVAALESDLRDDSPVRRRAGDRAGLRGHRPLRLSLAEIDRAFGDLA
jgi:hypothetical protein